MQKIWELYENMNEIVYVTDMDDLKMVYMNRYGLAKVGFSSMEEVLGKPCYEIIRKGSVPCTDCRNGKLKPGEFYEWKYENPFLEQTYLIKETMLLSDGRHYHLLMAIDISYQERNTAARQYQTNESVVNEALRTALAAPTPEKSLQVLLKYMGEALKSERIYVFEENKEHNLDNTYEWCAKNVQPQKHNLQNVPKEVVEIWYKTFRKNENVIIKDIEHIKTEDPLAYEYLKPQEIRSLVVSPMISQGKIIGFYGVDNPPKEMLDHISIMFMVLGHFITSILRRRDLVQRLENLSYYDQLTGALNRHGMNEMVANMDHEAPIGIVYADVMGLKKVNDTLGHLEGDKLLTYAYQCLADHFEKNTVFRIGGDEFLMMSSRIGKDELEARVKSMAQNMKKYGVHLAYGWIWEEQCAGRIMELLKEADRRMYENKRSYYETHPERG